MPIMIQVTLNDGKGYVNASFIQAVQTSKKGDRTLLYMDALLTLEVKETKEEIMRLIDNALKYWFHKEV